MVYAHPEQLVETDWVAAHSTDKNVRVVQYGMGTVITPFTNAEQPLETFTDPGFNGASKLYTIYTYYDSAADLGLMYRNISSFKLKRGFMATFGALAASATVKSRPASIGMPSVRK